MWIDRIHQKLLHNYAESRPVVMLTGARQTGKSSLLKREFTHAEYITFDHIRNVESAKNSPEFFLNQLEKHSCILLDEIQYVPELLREIKILVDNQRKSYGKWILTGSQQFELMSGISESLAGRISIIHLETLSAHELRNSAVKNINDYIWKGGYPEIWSNQKLDINDYFESYIRTYIERDLRTIIEVKNLFEFQKFIRVIASRVGQLLNYSAIANDTGVSDVTIRSWIHTLETSGVIYLLTPYFSNIGKRLIKAPKIYFADHGLLCHLLGIKNHDNFNNHVYKGNIWENIMLMELIKTLHVRPGKDIFFYRDQNGVEVDFVIEKNDILYFIEAKASEKITKEKYSFKKVIPLFQKKWKTRAFLFHTTMSSMVSKQDDFFSLNPLFIDIDLDM